MPGTKLPCSYVKDAPSGKRVYSCFEIEAGSPPGPVPPGSLLGDMPGACLVEPCDLG